ncbi:hypothetical protein I5Q82_03805 [Acutalibacter muris]|jgi:hypothetical protein|uniref:Flagellar protein FlgN n=1 Tax=Acutalibacter muris TaxID=1796620 RepID=A0A1Z2XT00_9FIRM|nr:hypothetical protein [Acutalibacter muris]ANU55192.1 hypothetical protein A4V00_14875 [Hungateiclostridiaceae bacterium KB18]ASB41573.1 hypothetical protein ADH66_13465 [Acutalibacter muris]MCI9192097.1 hypothetical protein [Acutalibacter muris]MCI9543637.1 hypothetical protein [Acutalibacter muris]QQR30833.1 hypothetical protein I5Q82_03805 [Acutalibacter muris]
MDIRILEELLLKERLLYVKLSEFEDLTRQLGEALDRRDEISVQMLLNMRGEPANQLQEADGQLRRRLLELPEEDAIRARELLEGGEQQGPEEAALCAQVKQNQRLLRRCREMDKHISVRMGGNKSFYKKYR